MPNAIGFDAYAGDPNVNLATAAANDVVFVGLKATEGRTINDSSFAARRAACHDNGVTPIFYHFCHPANGAAADARHFLSVVGALRPGELLAADMEVTDGCGPLTVERYLHDFLEITDPVAMAASGHPTLVYTGKYFAQDNLGGDDFADHPLWLAGYTGEPNPPAGWNWTIWQYSDSAQVPGLGQRGDGDVFNGDDAAFAAWMSNWIVAFPDGQKMVGIEREDHVWVAARKLGTILGLPVTWDAPASEAALGGTDLPTTIVGATGYVPIREACQASGLTCVGDKGVVTVSRPA